jgi:hypothetical protein
MSISMYAASAPRFDAMLGNLAVILRKGAEYAATKKIDPNVLLEGRLFPDMFPLKRQVMIACDNAKGPVARLAGIEVPKHEDTEQTFEELLARIAKVQDFIRSVRPEQIDGSEGRAIEFKIGGHELKFTGQQYLLGFAIPNFHFHLVTAYNILRHNGVEIGKTDYMGQP